VTVIRYRLPAGERFTIEARTRERVVVGSDELLDLEVSFVLACEVVAVDGDVADISGRFGDAVVSGHVLGGRPPDLGPLDGLVIGVRKGVDGRVHKVDGGEAFEALLGGLTVANGLRWFGAVFPAGEVALGTQWAESDRWVLRAAATPIGVDLPVEPVVNLTYRYRLEGVSDGAVEIGVEVEAHGATVSDALGLELTVSGHGTGSIIVDAHAGKLTRSRREARFDVVARPQRRNALALPPMRIERSADAGFTDAT